MKRILRSFLIETTSLYLVSQVAQGLVFEKGTLTLIIAGGALTIVAFLAKPVINMLLLPINLVTFGLFKWVSSAIALYLVTLVVSGFKVVGFNFVGYSDSFTIPAIAFSGFLAYIAFSLLLSVLTSFIHWILK